ATLAGLERPESADLFRLVAKNEKDARLPFELDDAERDERLAHRAVPPANGYLQGVDAPCFPKGGNDSIALGGVVPEAELRRRLAHGLFPRPAERRLERGIHLEEPAVGRPGDPDGFGRCVKYPLEPLLALLEGGLHRPVLGDVRRDDDGVDDAPVVRTNR